MPMLEAPDRVAAPWRYMFLQGVLFRRAPLNVKLRPHPGIHA